MYTFDTQCTLYTIHLKAVNDTYMQTVLELKSKIVCLVQETVPLNNPLVIYHYNC